MAIERTRVAPGKTEESQRLKISHTYSEEADQVLELGADRFVLRVIRPEDGRAYSDFIARVDESDLRRRFIGEERGPEADLALLARIDYDREMAFVAIRNSVAGNEEIVGEVRAYLYPEVSAAEVAIIVRTDMKRRGVGRALMEKMIEYGKVNGLELFARIAPQNNAMIRLAERSGMQLEYSPAGDLAVAHIGRSK